MPPKPRHNRTRNANRTVVRLLAATGLLALCVILWMPGLEAGDPESPIERAIAFLAANQVTRPVDVIVNGARVVDFPGNWPQHFTLRGN